MLAKGHVRIFRFLLRQLFEQLQLPILQPCHLLGQVVAFGLEVKVLRVQVNDPLLLLLELLLQLRDRLLLPTVMFVEQVVLLQQLLVGPQGKLAILLHLEDKLL